MVNVSVGQTIEKLMQERGKAAIVKDLLAYFNQNRKALKTSSELAASIHRQRSEVHPVLEVLVKVGILVKRSAERGECYLYKPDAGARVEIQKHLRTLPTKQRKLQTGTDRFRKSWGRKY